MLTPYAKLRAQIASEQLAASRMIYEKGQITFLDCRTAMQDADLLLKELNIEEEE